MPGVNDVIVASTAVVYPNNVQDIMGRICISRLQYSRFAAADVNLDGLIDQTDVNLVQTNGQFVNNVNSPSACTGLGANPCGRVDVNNDGKVNPQDVTVITQSLPRGTALPTGARVQCGVVYLTEVSCQQSPTYVGDAAQITLDTNLFFNNDGTNVAGLPVRRSQIESHSDDETEIKVVRMREKSQKMHDAVARLQARLDAQNKLLKSANETVKEAEHKPVLWIVASAFCAIVVTGVILLSITRR